MKRKQIKIERFEGQTVFNLPDDIAMLLGRIVARWANIEAALKVIVYNLVGVSDVVGRIAIGAPRLDTQVDVIEQLFTISGCEVEPPVTELKKHLVDAAKQRDRYAHGIWTTNPQTGHLQLLDTGTAKWGLGQGMPTLTRRMFPEAKDVTANDLNNFLGTLNVILEELLKLNEPALLVRRSLREGNPDLIPERPPPDNRAKQKGPEARAAKPK